MHRASFWQLVELLTQASGVKYEHQPEAGGAADGGAATALKRSHGAETS